MPVTTAVAVLAALSLAGSGPFLSFIGKEMLLAAVLASPVAWLFLTLAVVLAGASLSQWPCWWGSDRSSD